MNIPKVVKIVIVGNGKGGSYNMIEDNAICFFFSLFDLLQNC